jgi:LemA protein
MSLSLSGFLALVGVVALTIVVYNRLAALARRCEQAMADIDVQLRLRHDLIPSLVETVRSFVAHERGLFETIATARARAMRAADPGERMEAETVLTSGLLRLVALAESNPTSQASSHFAELRSELVDVNNKIAAARRFFNLAVSEYNATLDQFPGNLIGRRFGLTSRRSFDLGIERVFFEDAPAVKL